MNDTLDAVAKAAGVRLLVNLKTLPLDRLQANTWNPNTQSTLEFQKLCRSIEQFGFVAPILAVEENDGSYTILEGEHRWRAIKALGGREIPVNVVGRSEDIPPVVQRQITLFMNEVKGTHDPARTAALIEEMFVIAGDEVLLPYSDTEVNHLLGQFGSDVPLPQEPGAGMPDAAFRPSLEEPRFERRTNTGQEDWRTLTFRMPEQAYLVVRQALDAARDDGAGDDDFQCLEAIAAEFIAGHVAGELDDA